MRAAEALLDFLESIVCSQRDPLFQVRHRYLLYVACIGFLVMVGVQIVLLPYTHYNEYRERAAPHPRQHLQSRPGRDNGINASREEENHGWPDRKECRAKLKFEKVGFVVKTEHEKNLESPLTIWPEPSSLNSTCENFLRNLDYTEPLIEINFEKGILYNDRCGFLNYIELVLHERLDMCPNLNQSLQLHDKTATTTFLSNFKAYRKLLVDKIPQCSLEDPMTGVTSSNPGPRLKDVPLNMEHRTSTGEAREKSPSLLATADEHPLVEDGVALFGDGNKNTADAAVDNTVQCSPAQDPGEEADAQEREELPAPAKDEEQKLTREYQKHKLSRSLAQGKKLPLPMEEQHQLKPMPEKLPKQQPNRQKKIDQYLRLPQQLHDQVRKQHQQERQRGATSLSLSRCSLSTLRTRLLQCIPPRVLPSKVADYSSSEKEGYFCQFNYVLANIVNSQTAAKRRAFKTFATTLVGSMDTSRNSSISSNSFQKGDGVTTKKVASARRIKMKLPQIVLSRADGVQKTKFPEIKVNMRRSKT